MIPKGFTLYLASGSPRRRDLLKQLGVRFELLLLRERPPRERDVSETALTGEDPEAYVRRVACAKAAAAWSRVAQRGLVARPVLAADTAVYARGELLGKPRDHEDAARMLRLLSGTDHRVFTAVAMQYKEHMEVAVNESVVRFRELAEQEIAAYLASGESMDKAGAYAVQGRAAAFIAELRGSYSGVVGLPLYETAELIGRFAAARS